jgi:hypothetical protein
VWARRVQSRLIKAKRVDALSLALDAAPAARTNSPNGSRVQRPVLMASHDGVKAVCFVVGSAGQSLRVSHEKSRTKLVVSSKSRGAALSLRPSVEPNHQHSSFMVRGNVVAEPVGVFESSWLRIG